MESFHTTQTCEKCRIPWVFMWWWPLYSTWEKYEEKLSCYQVLHFQHYFSALKLLLITSITQQVFITCPFFAMCYAVGTSQNKKPTRFLFSQKLQLGEINYAGFIIKINQIRGYSEERKAGKMNSTPTQLLLAFQFLCF